MSSKVLAEDQERIYRSAYFLGRGDAGLSIADDQDAIFYNPAGVALGKGIFKKVVLLSPHVEISDDTRNLYREMVTEDGDKVEAVRSHIGKPQHVGVYNFTGVIFRRAALGFVSAGTTDLLVYKSPDAGALESIKGSFVQTNGVTFSLADSFASDHVYLGTTLKYLQRGQAKVDANVMDADKIQDMKSSDVLGVGYGGGADVGLMLRGKEGRINPSCGATVMNAGGTRFKAANENATALDNLHQTVNIGCAVEPGTKTSRFKLIGDYWDITNQLSNNGFKKTHFGMELSILNLVGFTAGLSQGAPSAGFYLNLYLLRLDAGMYTEEVDDRVGVRPDKRLFVRLMLGF